MSLQIAAQHMASRGRGPDTQLVHMAPQEVAGLQALAKAHGGSLTINPETGLAEAGFLKRILPTLIGAGLSFIPGVGPLMAAGIVGGGYTVATGSLEKGLMAGLGAYGGAGLAGGLTAAGAASGAGTGMPELLGDAGANLVTQPATFSSNLAQAGQGISSLGTKEGFNAFIGNAASKGVEATGVGGFGGLAKTGLAAAGPMMAAPVTQQPEIKSDSDMGQRYTFAANATNPTPTPDTPGYGNQGQNFGREQNYFKGTYTPIGDDEAKDTYGFAAGGPVEQMSNLNSIGANTGFPQSGINTGAYATPYQQPISRNVVTGAQDAAVDPYTGQMQFAKGGLSDLGDYSDGGRLLRGPGDGVSDDIPAMIGNKQPARLADGEFVVPARIVSELGNGSTEAGARKLYAMMARVQSARKKSIGKDKVATDSKAHRLLPA